MEEGRADIVSLRTDAYCHVSGTMPEPKGAADAGIKPGAASPVRLTAPIFI